MGSATAWQLSRAGENVLLLEQQDEEYTFGSSFGEARICRSLGPKNDIWSYLHRRALEETEILIQFLNANDSKSHSMEDIYTDSPVTYILHSDKSEVVKRMLRQQDDNYECATSPEEALRKFGVRTTNNRIVIQEYRRFTGTINPKMLIRKLHKSITLKKGEIRYQQQVQSITIKDGVYEVEFKDLKSESSQKLKARKIISAAGPYTGTLLKRLVPSIDKLITPKRVFLAFLKIDPNRFDNYSPEQKQRIFNFFPLIDLGPDHIFSMIEKKDANGHPLFKVGGHFLREEISNLDETWKKELTANEIEWSKKSITDYFEFLNIPLDESDLTHQSGYSCVYSMTESEIPIVSNLPNPENSQDPNAVLLGGMSGVGAKGSLTYGLLATHLLLGKEEDGFMYQKVKRALSLN